MAEHKKLHIALWIVAVLIAIAFGAGGAMKAFAPMEMLAENMPWVNEYPSWLPRFIGVSELLGAIGLIVPALTRIQPKLTGIAAACLVLVMILAAGFHVMRSEFPMIAPNVVLGGLAAFVAWGRLVKVPITASNA